MKYDHQMPEINLHEVNEVTAERTNHNYFSTTRVRVGSENGGGLKAVLYHDPDLVIEVKVRKRTDAEKKREEKKAA
jgi:hypothetical protein|tara:strand:+ start:8504 stop:8731 length:228 start_codon:yes stop_codon:yes gene_type:complete